MPPINATKGTTFEGRMPKYQPVQGLKFWHKWNSEDFVGRYHIDRFATKHFAVPGTAIVLEEQRDRAREDDIKRFEKDLSDRAYRRRHRVKVKREGAAMRSQIELNTMLGVPIEEVETILNEKAEDLKPTKKNGDTQKEIDSFFRNIRNGNWNYICYASTLGFRSINSQDEKGDTPLQIAVRQGDLATAVELLKYCAEPNFRNILGQSSQHEAWSFWKFHHNRTKEERLAQEQKTYDLLHAMFSYGGFVDAQNAFGETALHIACRMGPTKVVLLCLGFKANVEIRTKERTTPSGEVIGGQRPRDLAQINGKQEIVHLLDAWERIRHQLILNDFVVVWRKFLKDNLAVITENQDAKQILFDLNMDMKVSRVLREMGAEIKKTGMPIDDAYMRQTLAESRRANAAAPRPWQRKDWLEFVEKCEASGIDYHLTQEERDFRKIQRESEAVMESLGFGKKKDTAVDTHLHMTPQELARSRLPEREKKVSRVRLLHTSGGSRTNTAGGLGSAGSSLGQLAPLKSPSRNLGATSPTQGFGIVDASGSQMQEGALISMQPNASPRAVSPNSLKVTAFGPDFDTSDSVLAAWPKDRPAERPRSQLSERRISSARAVTLDATFFRYTKRPATASALGLPLRSPNAPLDGTEEEKNILRYISDQGMEYDLVRKARGKNMRKALGCVTERPTITAMGDYNTEEKITAMNEREKLFSRLATKPKSDREAAEDLVRAAQESQEGKAAMEAKLAEPVEMINGRRSRFVDADVIPPDRKETGVERALKEQQRVQEEEQARKLGLSGENMEKARRALEERLLTGGTACDVPDDASAASSTHREKVKSKKDALRQRMLMRSQKKKVQYGMNRVTSTHNSKGEIEAPWSTTGGRYTVREGDRTA